MTETARNNGGIDDNGGEGKDNNNNNNNKNNLLQPELVLTKILDIPSTFDLVRTMVATKAYESWTDLMIRVGVMKTPPPFTIAQLDPIPSDATVRALELAQQLCEPSIVNHMIRTYYFGMAINVWNGKIQLLKTKSSSSGEDGKEEVDFDREAFWVASVLHDVGICSELSPPTQPIEESITSDTFFEIRGGIRAHTFVTKELETPFDPKRAWLVHEAIALHTSTVQQHDNNINNSSSKIKNNEGLDWATMLFDGAATDLVAMKLGKVSPTTISEIIHTHPKLDLHTLFPRKLRQECKDRPCCLIAQTGKIGLFEKMEQGGAAFTKYETP